MVMDTSLAIVFDTTFLPLARETVSAESVLVSLKRPRAAVLAEIKSLEAPQSMRTLRRRVARNPTRASYEMSLFLAAGCVTASTAADAAVHAALAAVGRLGDVN